AGPDQRAVRRVAIFHGDRGPGCPLTRLTEQIVDTESRLLGHRLQLLLQGRAFCNPFLLDSLSYALLKLQKLLVAHLLKLAILHDCSSLNIRLIDLAGLQAISQNSMKLGT